MMFCVALVVGMAQVTLLPMPKEIAYASGAYAPKDAAKVTYVRDASLPAEGYRLTVAKDGVTVRHADAAGRFYAGVTLDQLKGADGKWPCVTVRDWPTYGYRGVLVDDARVLYGKEELKKIIDQMSKVKLNVFHWHLIETENWRLVVPGYPKMTEKLPPEGRYTRADIREVVEYAAARAVRVMPEVEMPGHNNAVAHYREFAHEGGHGLCPTNPKTIEFFKAALDEAVAAFPGEMIHFGGDEVEYASWKKCPRCQAKMKELGLKEESGLQAWFMDVMARHLVAKGKRPVGWSDMLLTLEPNMKQNDKGYWTGYGIRKELSKDIAITAWYGDWECAGGCGAVAANLGYKVLQYPSIHCYFDYRQGLKNDPHKYANVMDLTLEKAYMWDPASDVEPDKRGNVLGVGCANWSEMATDRKALEWKLWPRGFATAEVGWGAPAKKDYAEFARRAKARVAAFRAAGVNAAPVVTVSAQGVPSGCDEDVMSEAYWKVWNDAEQAKIDADIEANRKADGTFCLPVPAGTVVEYEQLDHEFRFGAHIFNFNQLGKTEYNDAYKASYGAGGIFNQATVAFYWNNYEPTPGHRRAHGMYEDSEAYWNSLSIEAAQHDRFWRRPAPGPVIDFLKAKDVAIHGHILVWGSAKPYWIYDWYCPENEKRAFDAFGIPRHSTFMKRTAAGAELGYGFAAQWRNAWLHAYPDVTEEEISRCAPVFTKNMRRVFRDRVFGVAKDFGEFVDSWDVVNESSVDWALYRKSRTGLGVWKSNYGLMPGDYPLHALLDAKEAFPATAKLAINDYNICEDFLAQVKDLERESARIDLVGCQMHIFNTNDCMRLALGATNVNWVGTPKVIQDRLDMMAKTGRRIHVSEITITSPGADARSRQIQAVLTRNIYRKWFSHKALMGITWWNTVDGGGVFGEPLVSGLFTRDMKKKPAYEALDELINREWKTKGIGKVEKVGGGGDGGVLKFRGFLGRYRLSWTCPKCGKNHSRVVELTGDGVRETAPSPCPNDCLRYAKAFSVDGKAVRVGAKETVLDLKRIYPKAVALGSDGDRWAEVACTLVAPKDGTYEVRYQNDWFGRLFVNGARVGGDLAGPYNGLRRLDLRLKAGENKFVFQTRAGSAGGWTFTLCVPSDSPISFK